MSKTKESIMTLLIIVAFLALTAIAAVLFGGNAEQKAKVENNVFWQKTRAVLSLAFSVVPAFINTDSSPSNNTNGSDLNKSSSSYPDSANIDSSLAASNSEGFWSGFVAKLKAEWFRGSASSVQTDLSNINIADLQNNLDTNGATDDAAKFLDWQSTDKGGEIIFRRKNGVEYKLSIPFRIFSGK